MSLLIVSAGLLTICQPGRKVICTCAKDIGKNVNVLILFGADASQEKLRLTSSAWFFVLVFTAVARV